MIGPLGLPILSTFAGRSGGEGPGLAKISDGAAGKLVRGREKTPGGKLIDAFPPGAISRPAARRESQTILRRHKLKCQ